MPSGGESGDGLLGLGLGVGAGVIKVLLAGVAWSGVLEGGCIRGGGASSCGVADLGL